MLRMNLMRCSRIDLRQGGERCAAWVAAALVLSGCSSVSTPTDSVDTGSTSRFTSLFSGSSPATPVAAGGAAFNPDDCPPVDIRAGAGTMTLNGKPPEAASTDVRYQLTFTQLARQCVLNGGEVVMKVGVQGRIIVGPIGGPGSIELPIRYAVVREGLAPRTIATKFKRVPAEVPAGRTNLAFSDVEESLSFPMPSRAELPAYIVYVGFDEIGDASEKKPVAKKPAVKKPAPKIQ
ncbi:MAG TPA: hypothetical protein VGN55_13925 [Xanthobacteraceae bacterium]